MVKTEDYYSEKEYYGHEVEPIDTLDKPLVIEVAPTGSFLRRDVNPNQPYTPEEVAEHAIAACDAGASMCHVHVRNEEGMPDQRPETYAETIDRIREEHDPVTTINVRSNRDGATYGRQLLEETLGELIDEQGPGYIDLVTTSPLGDARDPDAPFVMNPDIFQEWVEFLQERDVKPEFQAYAFQAFENIRRWGVDPGLVEPPYYVNTVTGNHAYFRSGPAEPFDRGADYLSTLKHSHPLPDEDTFQGAIIGGRNWLPMTTEAILQGYDLVRIGMEDAAMLYPHRDDPIESCGQVVEKVATIARELGREVATPDQTRELLGL